MPDEAPVIRATLPAKASDLISVPPRSNTASFYQHTTARATACTDHLDRVGDEPAILHHLPELLQNVRTNEDRIASHRDTHLLSVAITARTQGSGHGQSWRCYAWPGPPRPARTSSTTFPAYLALEPVAADSPERLVALLIGVDLGPLITDWVPGDPALAGTLHQRRRDRICVAVRSARAAPGPPAPRLHGHTTAALAAATRIS